MLMGIVLGISKHDVENSLWVLWAIADRVGACGDGCRNRNRRKGESAELVFLSVGMTLALTCKNTPWRSSLCFDQAHFVADLCVYTHCHSILHQDDATVAFLAVGYHTRLVHTSNVQTISQNPYSARTYTPSLISWQFLELSLVLFWVGQYCTMTSMWPRAS